ncbi:MAG: ferrochelatase [Pseudobdellovibrionaceae bacterium]
MAKIGVLLLNIGSPPSYEVSDVKKYLHRFLMDKDVINIPFPLRWLLVHGIIVPKRGQHSANNYKKIWIENEGSPLSVYTAKFAWNLQNSLGESFIVKIGMRYSQPSIELALREFDKCQIDRLILVPLYPQYAEATTGSSLKEVQRLMERFEIEIPSVILPPFFKEDAFTKSYIEIIKDTLGEKTPDHYLFSFHGLPESHIRKAKGCLSIDGCCFEVDACNKNCYRAQCYATATKIAEDLKIPPSHWSVSFQSRLGRGEWLKPATDHTLQILAKKEKSVAVICPSFVTDCLETLEEIGMEGQALFKENGGKEFILVPCLNERENWVQKFSMLIRQ